MRILLGTHIIDQMTKKLDFLFWGQKVLMDVSVYSPRNQISSSFEKATGESY